MNAQRNTASADQKPTLGQRARASRRSADRLMKPSPDALLEGAPTTCAAARLGDILEDAWAAYERLQDVTTAENATVLEPLDRHSMHLIGELESAVSYARAASPTGMLTQLAVAYDALDLATTGSDRVLREAASTRAERCLHSVAAALSAMTGIDREGSCVGRYMSASNDRLAFLSPEVLR